MKYVYVCCTNPSCDTIEKAYQNKAYLLTEKLLQVFDVEKVIFDVCPDGEGEQINLQKLLSTPNNIIITPKPTTLAHKFHVLAIIDKIVNTGNDVLFCNLMEDGNLMIDTLSTTSIDDLMRK